MIQKAYTFPYLCLDLTYHIEKEAQETCVSHGHMTIGSSTCHLCFKWSIFVSQCCMDLVLLSCLNVCLSNRTRTGTCSKHKTKDLACSQASPLPLNRSKVKSVWKSCSPFTILIPDPPGFNCVTWTRQSQQSSGSTKDLPQFSSREKTQGRGSEGFERLTSPHCSFTQVTQTISMTNNHGMCFIFTHTHMLICFKWT